MKKLFILFTVIATSVQGQFIMSTGGFYSKPLSQFEIDNYQDGYGFELGFGYQFPISKKFDFEINTHWQWGENDERTSKLPLGNYTIENDFIDWHFEGKLLRKYKYFHPYIGLHLGSSNYNTNEYLKFNNPDNYSDPSASDDIFSRSVFQYGASIGTYVKVTNSFYLDWSISVNKGAEDINYVDFDSYLFDGTDIYYNTPSSNPFLLLFNFGLTFKFNGSGCCSGWSSYSESSSGTSYNPYSTSSSSSSSSSVGCVSGSSSSSGSGSGSSSSHYGGKAKEKKIIKKGKTPVGFN